MSYEKILKKLQNLPPSERQLAEGKYVDDNGKCGCAIGKALPKRLRRQLLKCKTANGSGLSHIFNRYDTNREARKTKKLIAAINATLHFLGLSDPESNDLQANNDGCLRHASNRPKDKRRRYKKVIAWLKKSIREESIRVGQ